jgi:hypothetical protein
MVVRDASELVGREIIVTPNDEIAEVTSGGERLRAESEVMEADGFAVRNTEAPIHACAGWNFVNAFGAAGSGINRFFFALMRCLQCAEDILARASARIQEARGLKTPEFRAVKFDAFALVIGRVRPANIGALVPSESKPFQVFDESSYELRARARTIEVFIAKDQFTPRGASALLSDPESARMPEMEQAGR